MKNNLSEILVVKDTFHYKKGTVVNEKYKEVNEGIEIGDEKRFLSNNSIIRLNETLTSQDEKRIKDMIRNQLKYMFWQMYSKQSYLLGNL